MITAGQGVPTATQWARLKDSWSPYCHEHSQPSHTDTDEQELLAILDADLAEDGRVSELAVPPGDAVRLGFKHV